jgi:hypothetical protein
VGAHNLTAFGQTPGADPLIAALSDTSLLGLGRTDPGITKQSLALQQLLANTLQSGVLNKRQHRLMTSAAGTDPAILQELQAMGAAKKKDKVAFLKSKGMSGKEANKVIKGLPVLERQLVTSGYSSLDELFQSQEAQAAQAAELAERYRPVAERVQAGQLASQGRIGDYLKDLPNLLTGEANPFTERLREQAMAASQKYGTNPHAFLEQADAVALQRALQLISGEQAVAGQPHAQAMQVAQLRQQGNTSAAQLGAAQAQQLAQAQFFNAQQQQQYDQQVAAGIQGLGSNLMGAGLIGYDITGGGGGGAPQAQQQTSIGPASGTGLQQGDLEQLSYFYSPGSGR